MLETVRAGREVPYAWRRRRRGLPRGLLRTDSPSACSRTTTVRPKKRACVEETTPPKTERASPVVFCSTLRCEARFSIGRIARKLCRETPLRRGMRTGKTRAQNPARAVDFGLLLQGHPPRALAMSDPPDSPPVRPDPPGEVGVTKDRGSGGGGRRRARQRTSIVD